MPCQRAALFGEELCSLKSLRQILNCLELLLCKSPPMASALPETPVPHHHELAPCRPKATDKRGFPGSSPPPCL